MSFTCATLSLGAVNEADARGRPRRASSYAALAVGAVGSARGRGTCAHASISVSPVDAPGRCVRVTRTFDVSTGRANVSTFGRRPAGRRGERRAAGAGTHAPPLQTSAA